MLGNFLSIKTKKINLIYALVAKIRIQALSWLVLTSDQCEKNDCKEGIAMLVTSVKRTIERKGLSCW